MQLDAGDGAVGEDFGVRGIFLDAEGDLIRPEGERMGRRAYAWE